MPAAQAVYLVVLAAMAVMIPARGLPDQSGPTVAEALLRSAPRKAQFPTWLAFGTVWAVAVWLAVLSGGDAATWWLALLLAAGLAAALTLGSLRAPALQDLALPPVLALLAMIAVRDLAHAPLTQLSDRLLAAQGLTEQRMPWDITVILMLGAVPGLAAFWRARHGGAWVWAAAAALIAPLAGIALELVWRPSALIGVWPWALHALALAGLMTLMAERFARAGGADRRPVSLVTLSALACSAFALGLVLTTTALTLALAVTVLAAAALDRRFDLPLMSAYIAAGVVALSYRLVADPGLIWANTAPIFEVILTYVGAPLALVAAHRLLPDTRPRARVFTESAAWSAGAIALSVLLYRAIDAAVPSNGAGSHWHLGLNTVIWLALMLVQLYRLKLGGALRWLRIGLAVLFALAALLTMLLSLAFVSPLWTGIFHLERVIGPPVFNSLIPAYLLPAGVLLAGVWRLDLHRILRWALLVPGLALAAFWAGTTVRHIWQGAAGMELRNGVTQPELYSYTVALLALGAVLFYQALARGSGPLRRAGVAVIALAVAKVFLIDIAGLTGLVRVFSFLLLGLSLAGLAWLNRWIILRSRQPADPGAP